MVYKVIGKCERLCQLPSHLTLLGDISDILIVQCTSRQEQFSSTDKGTQVLFDIVPRIGFVLHFFLMYTSLLLIAIKSGYFANDALSWYKVYFCNNRLEERFSWLSSSEIFFHFQPKSFPIKIDTQVA